MLFINKKYKPMIPKQSNSKEKEQDFMPNIQGKGLNELIEKVKDMKVKELTKKRKTNSNSKISFN
jgi:hypothetical protein